MRVHLGFMLTPAGYRYPRARLGAAVGAGATSVYHVRRQGDGIGRCAVPVTDMSQHNSEYLHSLPFLSFFSQPKCCWTLGHRRLIVDTGINQLAHLALDRDVRPGLLLGDCPLVSSQVYYLAFRRTGIVFLGSGCLVAATVY